MVLAACMAAALSPALTLAQTAGSEKYPGYLVDTRGVIVRSGTGLCWHTSQWTPAHAVEGCDPVMKTAAAAPAPAPAPAPRPIAAPAPAQKPAVVAQAAPARPQPQRMRFSADALFDFDKSVLKPEGRAMLDDFANQLSGATYEIIETTGHTDRFGSHAYNQKLSERRANAVKDYLVSRNIPASRITASGKGETQPVTGAGECTGPKSARVIACLQPDRRVDVEMTGTKP